jgi:acid phosphatase type 7
MVNAPPVAYGAQDAGARPRTTGETSMGTRDDRARLRAPVGRRPGKPHGRAAQLIALSLAGALAGSAFTAGPVSAATVSLFSNGFETGSLAPWTTSKGVTLQQAVVADGSWAAQTTLNGAGAYASKLLLRAADEVTATVKVNVRSLGATTPAINFLKLRSGPGNVAIAEAYLTSSGLLGVRNDVAGVSTLSTSALAAGSGWHTVTLHGAVSTGRLDVTLDGTPVPALQLTGQGLGSVPVGRVQVGESNANRVADLVFDSVTVTGVAAGPAGPVFTDDFETGGLGGWTSNAGLTADQGLFAAGVWSARGVHAGAAGRSATKDLPAPLSDVTASTQVYVSSIGASSPAINFLKLRTAGGTAVAELYVTPANALGVRNDVTGVATQSVVPFARGRWHTVSLRATIPAGGGAAGKLSVVLDGVAVPDLQLTAQDVGSGPIGRIQLGENVAGRTADLSYDNVWVGAGGPPGDPVLAAVGDIACDPANPLFNQGYGTPTACAQMVVSDLILADPAIMQGASGFAVAPLGDVQYHCGGGAAFAASYDPSFGRFKNLSKPAIGNHELIKSSSSTPATDCDPTGKGMPYYAYFGARAGNPGYGYYSYELGAWHIIVLNSNCTSTTPCTYTSSQQGWLAADLAAHPAACTLAYFHHPLWSSGKFPTASSFPLVKTLDDAGVDVILAGHDHDYERFAMLRPGATGTDPGIPDPTGFREFVIGSGGANHTKLPGAIAQNSEVFNDNTFGYLRLTLHATSYDWEFVPEPGKTFTDSSAAAGSAGTCH